MQTAVSRAEPTSIALMCIVMNLEQQSVGDREERKREKKRGEERITDRGLQTEDIRNRRSNYNYTENLVNRVETDVSALRTAPRRCYD